jgi:hypothetical protein
MTSEILARMPWSGGGAGDLAASARAQWQANRLPRLCLLALSGLVLSVPAAAEPGFKVQCAGGTVAGVSAKAVSRLDLTGAADLVFFCGKTEFRTPYSKVESVEYGQNVARRYAAAVLISPILLLSKERKHYVTLGFVDGQGAHQAVVFRVDKGDIRSVLAALEARTGRRIEYQDEEARKGGKP